MALKNLNQMSTLGGGGSILNASTNRGSEFVLRQEEEKKKAEEKKRAQIRALDELEAEAGLRNLSQNKNAPLAQNFGGVSQNKPLSAIGKSGLGVSGKVIDQSAKSRSTADLNLRRRARDTIDEWNEFATEHAATGHSGIDLLDEFKEENARGAEAFANLAIANTKTGAAEIADLGVSAAKSIKGGLDFTKASGGGTKGMPTLGVPFEEHDTRTLGEKIVQNDSKAVLKDIGKDASTFAEGAEEYKKQYLTSGETLTDKAEREIEEVKEEYKDVLGSGAGKIAGDVVGSAARQLPRVLISAIPGFGGAAAGVTMFATSSNSAYKEALLNGATDEEAKMYSILAGAVEAGGEYAIGGILGQGTGYLDDLFKISKKITNPIARTAVKILGSSVGEGFEEMAQSVFTTIAQRITYDPDAKVDFTELAYEGLIGALSAGLMTAVNPAGISSRYRESKNEIGQIQAEKALGTMSSEDILSAIDSVRETAVELGQEELFNSALLSVYEKAYGDKASITERLKNNAKKLLDPETEAKANSLGILSPADLSENAKIAVANAAAKYGIGTAGTRVSGMESGVDADQIGEAERLSKLTGSRVEFFDEAAADGSISNGYEDNGIIHVNRQAKNPLAVVLSHELTHTLEGSSSYDDLSYIVFKTLRESGTDIGRMIDDRMSLYARKKINLTEDDARREIVADYVSENFMGSEEQIRNIVAQDRPLAVRIREFLDRVLARFGNTDAQERVQEYNKIREIRDAYKRALGERVDAPTGTKYSFAGVNSQTADTDALNRAQAMERSGETKENILSETGWFRGADGKWRYEIDDSGMKYYSSGDARFREAHPEYAEYQSLADKMINGTITPDEDARMRELYQTWGNERTRLSKIVSSGNAMLRNILDHQALFEAYPELETARVVFEELDPGTNGYYNRSKNTIALSRDLRNAPESALVHEIQHAIQNIEGFARGSSPEYWMRNSGQEYKNDARFIAADNKYKNIFDNAPNDFKNMVRAINRAHLDDDYDEVMRIEDELYASEYADMYSELSDADFDRRVAIERTKNRSPYNLYENTAGEIEARNVSARRNLTAEERRAKFPDIGNEDTVFANVVTDRKYSLSETTDGRPVAVVDNKRFSISKADAEDVEVRDEDVLYERGMTDEDDGTFSDPDLELLQAMRADQESRRESEDAETAAELDYYDGNRSYDAQGYRTGRDGDTATWNSQREAFNEIAKEAHQYNTPAQQKAADDFLSQTMGKIQSSPGKPTLKERAQRVKSGVESAYSALMRKMVDSGYTVGKLSKGTDSPAFYHSFNMARASANAGMYMIEGKQTDVAGNVVGEGLNEIINPIREKGEDYYKKFQAYLLHLHNQDRMSRQNLDRIERAKKAFTEFVEAHPELKNYAEYQLDSMAYQNEDAAEYIRLRDAMRREESIVNKPVFGYEVSAEQSAKAAEDLIKEHPEFADLRDQVYKYRDNLMQYRVDSGLLTAEDAGYIQSVYPHYVPVYRAGDFNGKGADAKNVTVGKTVKRAVGGDQDILPLHTALSKQTMSVVREAAKNRFGERLITMHQTDGGNETVKQHIKEVEESDYSVNENTFDAVEDPTPKYENTFTVRHNGKAYDIVVSPDLFEAVKSLTPSAESNNWIVKSARNLNTLYKSLITGYNPLFTVRNTIRDIQDAAINSKDLSEFAKAYPLAWKEITTNGEWWQRYKAAGGLYSSVFDYSTGEKKESSGIGKITDKIETANMIVEQVPRLTEFIATMKNGDGSYENLMEALYNANEVTTNFGRSGTWGKFLNSNFVPFLNPSIQGFDKMIRNVTETKGGKDWLRLIGKAAILGALPRLLNELLFGDEEDWDEIKERDKDIYYLFPTGDGEWVKIPKGRTISVIGTFSDAIFDVATEGETDLSGKLETAMSQVGPTNPLEENILKAWMDADLLNKESPGRTWYGTDIESQRLQGYAPGERYDERTDAISKWLGEKTGLSPKKINYLLDQYSGVIGDALLPILSPASSDGMFRNAFTMDTVYSNNLSEEFYNLLDELEWAKNSETATGSDTAAYRYMYNKMLDISDINKQIREAESNTETTNKAKQEEVEILTYMRNAIMRDALDQYESWRAAEDDYYELGTMRGDTEDEASDFAYNEANNEIFGAKYALEAQGSDVYKGAEDAVLDTDLSYEDYYEWYNNVRVKGGKIADQIDAITESDLSDNAKSQIYYSKYATAKEREVMDMFWQTGTPDAEMYETISRVHLAEKATDKRSVLSSSPLTEYEQSIYYFTVMASNSQKEKLADLMSNGITQAEYYTFLIDTLDISGENKKEQIMQYIDSTGMTSSEKDLLYLAAGYSESTIYDAPWHGGSFGGGSIFGNSGVFGGSSIFGDSGIFGDSNIFGESSSIFGEKGIFG